MGRTCSYLALAVAVLAPVFVVSCGSRGTSSGTNAPPESPTPQPLLACTDSLMQSYDQTNYILHEWQLHSDKASDEDAERACDNFKEQVSGLTGECELDCSQLSDPKLKREFCSEDNSKRRWSYSYVTDFCGNVKLSRDGDPDEG